MPGTEDEPTCSIIAVGSFTRIFRAREKKTRCASGWYSSGARNFIEKYLSVYVKNLGCFAKHLSGSGFLRASGEGLEIDDATGNSLPLPRRYRQASLFNSWSMQKQ